MSGTGLFPKIEPAEMGLAMHRLMAELYPLCRSITGDGVRQTLRWLQTLIPLTIHEVPSGTAVFDWTVPKEWNIRQAWVKNSRGDKVIDFQRHNLHVLNYSVPVRKTVSLAELKEHLFTLPDHPDWIPYRTSYYQENWGFCLSHRQYLELDEGTYEVCIESSLTDGHLTYGECYLPGETTDEVLVSCHVCHPSMANDNLSGIAVAVFLARLLASVPRRFAYRFLFIPGTIGSITWLARNEPHVSRIRNGLVLTCLGDAGRFTYKKSRRGDAEIDRAVIHVLDHSGKLFDVVGFSPYGYDERQYCSPGFNLPVGCFMRTPHGQFPEYHTSADDLDFVKAASLGDSLMIGTEIIKVLEGNRTYLNQNPKCEPRLGKRGLYAQIGGKQQGAPDELALLWTLNLADGSHDLLAVAERSGMAFSSIAAAAEALEKAGLLRVVDSDAH
jgi:aminopeptidase-like protein